MKEQIEKIKETLLNPDCVIQSKTNSNVELLYKNYLSTPVTHKFMCVVIKDLPNNHFIITAYFTDAIKKGILKWGKK